MVKISSKLDNSSSKIVGTNVIKKKRLLNGQCSELFLTKIRSFT